MRKIEFMFSNEDLGNSCARSGNGQGPTLNEVNYEEFEQELLELLATETE